MFRSLCVFVFSDSFSHIDNIFKENYSNENPLDEIDQITSTLLSLSPPSHQKGNLSLCQMPNNGYADFSALLQVKTEDSRIPFYSAFDYNNSSYLPNYGGPAKMKQRSFSSNYFERKPNFLIEPQFDSLMESSNFQSLVLSSPENSSSSSGQMRRVCSAGNLQVKSNLYES